MTLALLIVIGVVGVAYMYGIVLDEEGSHIAAALGAILGGAFLGMFIWIIEFSRANWPTA